MLETGPNEIVGLQGNASLKREDLKAYMSEGVIILSISHNLDLIYNL